MLSRAFPLILACLAAGGCDTPPASSADTGVTTPLDGLPLTAASRSELSAPLARLSAPEARLHCTDRELDFVRASLLALAVFTDETETAPWNRAEQAQVRALMLQFEALGGETGDLSDRCKAHVDAIAPTL
jgi:hypothetical protein